MIMDKEVKDALQLLSDLGYSEEEVIEGLEYLENLSKGEDIDGGDILLT